MLSDEEARELLKKVARDNLDLVTKGYWVEVDIETGGFSVTPPRGIRSSPFGKITPRTTTGGREIARSLGIKLD